MYSGLTITKYSGRVMGAHQKFDRVARRHLKRIAHGDTQFPGIRQILHYEGINGPDAIKRKSPAKDEPWHYYNPASDDNEKFLDIIRDHYAQLIREMGLGNKERAAFEASWLAHALVDGLTPAHHYPYEEKLTELRGGRGIESRTTYKEKLVMHGDTRVEKLRNNWRMWGGKGLFTTHATFELGIASLIAALSFDDAVPTESEIKQIKQIGIIPFFKQQAHAIAALDLYEQYYLKGWTPRLAYRVRHRLSPMIIKTITLTWYMALLEVKDK